MTIQDTSDGGRVARLAGQVVELQRFYGLLPMPPNDPFALFAWEVLSRKALPAGRDAALAALRKAHILTPDSVVRSARAALEAALAPAGPSLERRLDALRSGAEVFRRNRMLPATIRGPLYAARRSLRLLGQLDTAGAHRMLLYGGNHPIVPADPRMLRAAARLGYVSADKRRVRRARRELGVLLRHDPEAVRRAAVYLTHHGSVTCTERDPHCRVCPLARECPASERASEPRERSAPS
jgi:endonuclease III